MDIRRRYNNLYVPSDFFSARLCWAEVLPLHRPLKLGSRACSFHVRRRNVNDLPPVHDNSETCSTPSDASHLYSAKVYIASPHLIPTLPTLSPLCQTPSSLSQPHPHSPNPVYNLAPVLSTPIPALSTPSHLSQPGSLFSSPTLHQHCLTSTETACLPYNMTHSHLTFKSSPYYNTICLHCIVRSLMENCTNQ